MFKKRKFTNPSALRLIQPNRPPTFFRLHHHLLKFHRSHHFRYHCQPLKVTRHLSEVYPTDRPPQCLSPYFPRCPPVENTELHSFDPAKPRGLRRFFDDLRFQFARSGVVDEVEMNGYALRFVDCDTAELWEILPEFADSTAPYCYD